MRDPADIARSITEAFQATDTLRHGICPVCAGIHRLTRSRTLVRHGFKARNVRHGQSSGFHIGGHAGQDPIGTALGNREAIMEAQGHRNTAAHLALQGSITIADAVRHALDEVHASEVKSWEHRRQGDRPRPYATLGDLQATSQYHMVSGWFSPDALAWRVARMTRDRLDRITDHVAHAGLLVALVTLNPD